MALSPKAAAKAAELAAAKGLATNNPVPNSEVPESQPAVANAIFRKAGSLGGSSTLVFGGFSTGKSTVVRNYLLEQGKKPLWLALNNDAALQDDRVADWDVASFGTWDEFLTNIHKPAMRGELEGYDGIVIDGGNVLAAMAVTKQAPGGQAERADWLVASNNVRDVLVKLREKFGKLYLIVDVVPSKDTVRKIDFNPYMYNSIVPLFGSKWYTNIVRGRDANNKLNGERIFTLQKDADLALAFQSGEPVQA